MVSKYRPRLGATDERAPIEDIEAALQSVVRTLNQVRVHDRLLRSADVHVDRAGSALLYRLSVEPDGLRVTDLAERLGVDAPTVTRKVQQLEREGLVARREDPLDGRACLLGLTPEGKRIIGRVLKARRAWLTQMLRGWDDDDQAEFARLLSRFGEVLTRELDESHDHDHTPRLDEDTIGD